MPDRTKLRVGDKIRLLAVPDVDLRQRERELRAGSADPGWTANTIERILSLDPVVAISRIDRYGQAWFDYVLHNESGEVEEHSIAILDDESWQYC